MRRRGGEGPGCRGLREDGEVPVVAEASVGRGVSVVREVSAVPETFAAREASAVRGARMRTKPTQDATTAAG
ncbi:hypothetical protein SALBM311S_08452 [Streptomyces alboniger]